MVSTTDHSPTQVISHPKARVLATHGLASSHSFAPKQKEAQSRQKSEVSIHIALMGPRKLACRAGKRDLQNAVKTHYSSHTSETCPGEGGAPGPGKGSSARGGSHSWLSDHRSKGQTGRGTWRNEVPFLFWKPVLRRCSHSSSLPPCPLSPLSPRTHTPHPYAWPHHTS